MPLNCDQWRFKAEGNMNVHSCVKATIMLLIASFIGLALASCGNNDDTRKLVLTGSSTVAPLAAELAKRFEALHPGVRIDVQTGGSSRGIADARSGVADIGMASRSLKPEESDLFGTAIARDGIAIILHKTNPVEMLSDDQVVQIFKGTIKNWKDVGGLEAPISVINKAEGRSTLELFLKYYRLKSREVKASVIIGDNEQGIKTLVGNPNAIGYVSIGAAEFNVDAGTPIKILPTKGVEASSENVANGLFPLSRPLTLVTKEPPEGLAKEFIDFALSSDVHNLIKQLHFVPIQ